MMSSKSLFNLLLNNKTVLQSMRKKKQRLEIRDKKKTEMGDNRPNKARFVQPAINT